MSRTTNRINPRKLLLSKWTAVQPVSGEKHFQVTEVYSGQGNAELEVELLAVVSGRSRRICWRELKSAESWLPGWR